MKTHWILSLATLLLLHPQPSWAASRALFDSHDVIHLTIRGPLERISATAPDSKAPAAGTIMEDGGAPVAVQLSARGISRRQEDVCTFPPIRVEFTDKPPKGSLFHGQKKLKLDTHCRSAVAFQQYLLLEYGAYRLFNAMTPLSFNVRLVKIDYVEPSGRPNTSRLGFFIEDERDVAKRNGLESFKGGDHIPLAALQPQAAARTAMFEYMIGNLDWAMTAGPKGTVCCHNTKPVGPEGSSTGLIPVPHDFDMTGLVNPPYAAPPPGVTTTDVRQRQYRGFCAHDAEARAVAAEMLAKREALLAVFNDIPGMEDQTRHNAVTYLDGFFNQIGNERSLDALLKSCLR